MWPKCYVLGAILGGMLLVSACGNPKEEPEPLPTRIAFSTFTPTALTLPTNTPAPSPTLLPSATPTPFPSLTPSPPTFPVPEFPTLTPSSLPEFPTRTPIIIPSSTPSDYQARVISDPAAYVRGGPGLEYHVVDEVFLGEVLDVAAYAYDQSGTVWYVVSLADGRLVWISAIVVELEAREPGTELALAATIPPTATPTFTLHPSITPTVTQTPIPSVTPTLPQGGNARVSGPQGVNIREGAGYSYEIIGVIEHGEPLVLIGRNEDGTWYQAVTFEQPGRLGWVNADFVEPLFITHSLAVTWVGPPTGIVGVDCGVNIQPWEGQGWPDITDGLAQAEWVRFPFVSSQRHFGSLEEAFRFYDPIVNAYNSQGVNILLVLNHETYGEGRGWEWNAMNSAKWAAFTQDFVAAVEQIARHYGSRVAAYEIWNESDTEPGDAAAVTIPPADYAHLLDATAAAIRPHAPGARIVLGGLLSGNPQYLRTVQATLGGRLPVDAIAIHPYGRGAPDDDTVFSRYGTIATLINGYSRVAPDIPLWITEIGAMGDNSPGRWGEAARYMQNLFIYLHTHYPDRVDTIMWYAWSDAMQADRGTNGLVTTNNQPKSPLYDTFFDMCAR